MLPLGVRILVCTTPQDMRKSYDTLAAVVREALHEEPQSGSLYVFVGKRPTRVKVLWWDRNGYCLLCKRLHRALFRMPEASSDNETAVRIDGDGLAELLAGVDRENKRAARPSALQ
jgi:transposase